MANFKSAAEKKYQQVAMGEKGMISRKDEELRKAMEATSGGDTRKPKPAPESPGRGDRGPKEKYTNPRRPGETFEKYRARIAK